MISVTSMIIGALAGLVVTTAITLVWPKDRLRWARPLVSAGLGVAVAYLVMVLA